MKKDSVTGNLESEWGSGLPIYCVIHAWHWFHAKSFIALS